MGPIRSMERDGSSSCLFLLGRQQMQVLGARRQQPAATLCEPVAALLSCTSGRHLDFEFSSSHGRVSASLICR